MNWNTPHNLLRSILPTRMRRGHRRCLWNAPAPLGALVACVAIEAASGAPPAMVGPDAGAPAPVLFTEDPGVKEFSGRLVARPRQPAAVEVWDGADPVPAAVRLRALQAIAELEIVQRVDVTDEFIVSVPAGEDENSLARRLLATGDFEYVTPDWRVWPLGCPNDSLFFAQWHHAADKLGSCQAWSIEQGSPSIAIAICDTGIRASHVDLLRNRREAYNMVTGTWESQGGDISDIHGHGTWCTGTAAASGNDATGVAGVGWNLSHRMIRVSMAADGSAFMSTLTGAARLAADLGDRVVSVSYSGVADPSVGVTGAYVRSRNAMLVWAAGNESATLGGSRDDSVLVVGATDPNDSIAGFSNRGSFVDIVAPGVSIYTTGIGSDASWVGVNGTSFSCPMAAGLCGLIWSRNPSLSPAQVEQIIRASCTDLGAPGVDAIYGYGRIDSEAAMRSLLVDCNGNGIPDATDIASGLACDTNHNGTPDVCESAIAFFGDESAGQRSVPSDLRDVTAVAVGYGHSVALRSDGSLAAWGWNPAGQADIPAGLSGVIAIDADGLHSMALRQDGSVVCWGSNSDGQTSVPVGLSAVRAIDAGAWHNIALRHDGTVSCWGSNSHGQCSVPAGMAPVAAVAAGERHSVTALVSGSVQCWGAGDGRPGGDPNFGQSIPPAGLSGVASVAAGGLHSLALRSNGTVAAWGHATWGAISVPAGLSGVSAIAAGNNSSFALRSDGSIVCWGAGTSNTGVPPHYGQATPPAGMSAARMIRSSGYQTAVLMTAIPRFANSVTTPSTCGASNGAISVDVSGATSLSWSGPFGFTSTSEDLAGLAPGDYTLTASGPGGTATLTVIVAAAPDMTAPVVTSYTATASAAAGVACTASVPNLTSSVVATDNCTIASITQTPLAGASVGLGTHEVTIRVTDAAGNNAAVTSLFTVTGSPANYYADADHDGFGTGSPITACAQPANSATVGGDCNDSSGSIHPGAVETCFDHIDNNCNGQVDENCVPFTVMLSGSASSIAPGDTFIVRAMCTAPAADMGGAQLTIHFDAARLRLDAVDPVAPAGLNLEIAEQIDNTAGTLRYALGLGDPSVPLSGAADLCDLTFTVLPGADMCGAAGLVGFGNVGPFTTRFTAAATAAAVVPVLVDLAPVNLDTTAPALAGVPANISVATDAGSTFGALVSLPTVTATDDCDGPVAVTATGIPSGGLFPIGTTTVTWTATDAAGNTATSSRTVTVEPYQLLDAVVSLSNLQLGASRHALRIGTGAAVEVVDTLIPAWSGATPSSATVTVHVPVASSYPCVSAKSVGATVAGGAERASHTLTDTASASVSGSRYRAEFVLLSGDSNDDDMVEILDYGNWLLDRSILGNSVRAPEARSNYNGDAVVTQADVLVVVAYFFRVGESCTPGADAPRHPRERITVKELRRMGLGELAAADLNHDGWVDTRDMQMCMQGARPPQPAATASDAGGLAW